MTLRGTTSCTSGHYEVLRDSEDLELFLSFIFCNYYLQFISGTDHLLMIQSWCGGFNLAIEEFFVSRIVSKLKNDYTNFFIFAFFLLI